jgi:hypothetical protein
VLSLATTAVIYFAYYGYIQLVVPNQPMENANQFGVIVVYWIVGTIAGGRINLKT